MTISIKYTERQGDGYFIAHALEFDLVTTGLSSELAISKLQRAVTHHVEFASKHGLNLTDTLMRAPQEYWDVDNIKEIEIKLA